MGKKDNQKGKGEKKEHKFSASNIIATIILVIIVGCVIAALFLHWTFYGIVGMIKQFIENIIQTIGHYGLVNSIKMVFKVPIDPIPRYGVIPN